jgi:putative peptidoglycan lipid II flippase
MFHVKHLIKKEPFVRGIVLSSSYNLVSKIVIFGTSLLLAKYFGAELKTDLFWFLYNTLWLLLTIFSSVHIAVIVPEAIHIREKEGGDKAMVFFTFFFYVFAIISITLMALLLIDPISSISVISKYDFAILNEYRSMIYCFAPLFPLILVTQYIIDVLNAYRYFTLPVLTGLFNNLLTLFLICVFHNVLDIFTMVLAIYLGYGLNLLHLIYLLKRDFSWNFKPKKVNLKRNFKVNLGVGLLGNIGNFLGKFMPHFLMTGAGAGLLTAFIYGQKMTNVPTEAITNQFSSVAAIRLNELVAQKNVEKLRIVFLRLCNILIFILVPIAVLFYFFAEEIVSFLYFRGAFGMDDVKNTAYFIRYMGFLVPLYGINTIVTRLYHAGQIITFSTIYSLTSNLLFIGFVWFAFSYWGIWGIPFAFLAQNVLNLGAAPIIIRKFFKGIGYGKVLCNLLLFIIGCMLLGAGIQKLCGIAHLTGILKAIIGSMVFITCYIIINEVFHINKDVSNYLRKWLRIK